MADGDQWRIPGSGRTYGRPTYAEVFSNSIRSEHYPANIQELPPRPWGKPIWNNPAGGDTLHLFSTMTTEGHSVFTSNLKPDGSMHPNVNNGYEQSIQAPNKPYTLSPLAAEFVPRSYSTSQHALDIVEPPRQEFPAGDCYPVQQVRDTLLELTNSPGKFDVLVPTLAELLNVYVESEDVLAAVVDVLFQQSVLEANFRYNGARICGVFCKSLDIPASIKKFPQLLLERFYEEYKELKRANCDKRLAERLKGFAFFAGELFVNLELTVAGGTEKFAIIGDSLLEILEFLLTIPDDDNLKCVCQILKFSGTVLEDYELKNGGTSPLMDKIFHRIRDLTHNTGINRLIRDMLLRVQELRNSDWGRAEATSVVEPTSRQQLPWEAVLYGPDGQPLTVEEAHFLQSNGGGYEQDDDEDYDFLRHIEGGWSTADELDDEIAAAYEEFLREQEHPRPSNSKFI